jgi:hypothetical protein
MKVSEKGNAEPTPSGAVANKKTVAPSTLDQSLRRVW